MNKEMVFRIIRRIFMPFMRSFNAPFDIATGERIGGAEDFPADKAALVKAWIILHREDLFANWKMLSEDGQFFKIEPLR